MADKKISELVDGNPAADSDVFVAKRGSGNVRLTRAQILSVVTAAIAAVAADVLVVDAARKVVALRSSGADTTSVLGDAGGGLFHPASDNNPRTFTIDSNANVAYPLWTTLTFVNKINTLTIAITSDTLTFAGAGTTGSRTLAANGIATAIKIGTTEWLISGTGLT